MHITNVMCIVPYRDYDFRTRNEALLRQNDFISGQLRESEQNLKTAEQQIKQYKEDNNFLSIRVEANTLSRLISRLDEMVSELRKNLSKIRDAIEQVRSIGEFRTGTTNRVPVDDIDPGLARLNNDLVQAQIERDTLLENFTDNHPAVQEAKLKITNTVQNMLLVLQGREQSVLTELTRREKALNQHENRNAEIPEISLQLQRLERALATNMEVHTLLRQRAEEVKIKVAGTQHLVNIVKPAFRPSFRDNPPQVGLNAFVGGLLGLIVGLVFALVLETMDTSIGAIEDVESYLEVPVLGVIPVLDPEEIEKQYLETNPEKEGRFAPDIYARLVTHFVPRSPIAEAYRSFRTQMDFISLEKGGNTFVITSSTPGEGKTSTSINLAITLA